MQNYIKEKESCTIVSWRGEGRNRKCISIFNRKVALENYCVTVSITHDGEEQGHDFKIMHSPLCLITFIYCK